MSKTIPVSHSLYSVSFTGGFLEFQQHHPSLLETKTKTPHQQAAASLSQPCMPVTNIGPTKILPYLFLGSMKDALNADLAKVNISSVYRIA